MGKLSRDIPAEQRPFFKVFEEIAHRHNYSEVFDNYLTMLINSFADGKQQEWRDQELKKYSDKEKQLFNEMYRQHMLLFSEMIEKRGLKWYDSLGEIYQTITSNFKASAMGQFFTPAPVTNMIAAMTIGRSTGYDLVSEPCAGSGRMILSAHALQPMNYYECIDLDGMCAKMTAINMCMHNASGVVYHGNGLWLEHVNYKAYTIERVQLAEELWLPLLKVTDYAGGQEFFNNIRAYCWLMGKKWKTEKVTEPPPIDEQLLPVLEATNITEEKIQETLFEQPEQVEVIKEVVKEVNKRKKSKGNPDQLSLF